MIACMTKPTVQKAKILVIDDEIGPRESLRILLKNEFDVFCADSVDLGMQLLREHEPDTVIMDIRMPGMSGIEGLRAIRAIDTNVSVIMLTGFGALETAQEAIRLGATDYLKKPFDTREMQDLIRVSVKRTEYKRKRNKAERELEDLNRRLVVELADKDRLANLGQASQELVHDLRSPLTVVLGFVQILTDDLRKSKDGLGEQMQATFEYIDVIEKGVKRCRDLIEVWQNMGRKSDHAVQPVLISSMLRDIVKALEHLAIDRNGRIDLFINGGDSVVWGDNTQLYRTLQNVINNAIDALPDINGVVSIACDCFDDEVVIRVQDNGCGIDPENQKRIFEPYFTTKASNKGTGLGLYIAKKIVEEHQGGIDIESAPNKGTTVTIRLPAWENRKVAI